MNWSRKGMINSWLKRRIPRQKTHLLQHKNIFIVPSKTSLGFVVLIFLLWLLGTNYENNLVLAMAFLLLSLIIVSIHHTYACLAGLEVSVKQTQAGFVGEAGQVELIVKRLNSRVYESVELNWFHGDPVKLSLIDKDSVVVNLTVPLTHRGWFQPGRLKISTHFPVGLIYAWSHLDFDAPILAYPEPIESSIEPFKHNSDNPDDIEHSPITAGHEEFAGLRDYEDGDSLRHIDWRAMAKGQGLATRLYEDYVDQRMWLDWKQFEGMSREARLSRLCACVLQQDQLAKNSVGLVYGLRLPNVSIEPDFGELHKAKVLKALALFEFEESEFAKSL